MQTCDVLVAGGGPAGSACAWKLRQAGLDVVIVDRAAFPRDKVCAGWITPPVVEELAIDADEYRRGRTFQPITGFRTGMIGDSRDVDVQYDRPVSYGIRRCEFDDYLLRRSGARLALGTPVTSVRRDGADWVVNEALRTPMLVGAGGHFCPVARQIDDVTHRRDPAALVVAQEVEFAIDPGDTASFTTRPDRPELFFCRDLQGYGWCFRKERHLNVGFGRRAARSLPQATAEFLAFLEQRQTVPAGMTWSWRGHAYLLQDDGRRLLDAGVVLVGDAAGLAYPQSGEGIRPAIESGLLAAATIVEADGRYTRDRLEGYRTRLRARLGTGAAAQALSRIVPSALAVPLARSLLAVPAFVRHIVLDHWFLHAHEPALVV